MKLDTVTVHIYTAGDDADLDDSTLDKVCDQINALDLEEKVRAFVENLLADVETDLTVTTK